MIVRGPLSLLLFLKLLRCNADIVGVFGWARYLLPWKVCLAKRIRRWQVVGIPLFHTEEAWSREAVFPPLLSLCDAIITNTDHEKQFVEERVSRQVRILVGGVGIDSDAFSGRDAEQIRTRYHMGSSPVSEAPAYVCWGHLNSSALVRVPMYKPGKANSTRIEVRSPDPACNPYLALAVLLSAGLTGIEQEYELPPGAEEDVGRLTDEERRALGYADLPHNLADALRTMEESELVAQTLGEHVFDYFLRNKRAEWLDYRAKVTPYELERYLPVL